MASNLSLLNAQNLLNELIDTGKCTTITSYKVFACFFVLSNNINKLRLLSEKVELKSHYRYMQKKMD